MDKLSSTELFGKQAETCGTCGMEENEGCCHSETNLFVLEDDHFASYHSFGIKSLSPVLTVTPDFEVADLVVRHKHYTTPINAPPGDKEPVYLINRVFRI